MAADRVHELWDRALDGEALSPEEERELVAALTADEALRRALLQDAALHGLLSFAHFGEQDADAATRSLVERLAAERDRNRFAAALGGRLRGEPAPQPPPARRRWRPWAAAAAAAALVVIAAGAGWRLAPRAPVSPRVAEDPGREQTRAGAPERPAAPPATVARVADAQGEVLAIDRALGRPLPRGAIVLDGQGLMTAGARSRARLAYADGSTLEVGPATVVAAFAAGGGGRGQRVMLAVGTLRAEIAAQPVGRPFVVATPHGEATVLGTRFTLAVTADATTLAVEEGTVRLARSGDAEGTIVPRGETAQIGALAPRSDGGAARPTAVLVVGSTKLPRGDEMMARRLESLGFGLRLRKDGAAVGDEVRQSAVVVISSSAGSEVVGGRYRDLPVPIVVAEADIFEAMGMTPTGGPEKSRGTKSGVAGEVAIRAVEHPLAAGLSGTVRVAAGEVRMGWGSPAPLAIWAATFGAQPDQATVFGYDRGAPMYHLDAPARRVGLFMAHETVPALTAAGWSLFDAAIAWATGR